MVANPAHGRLYRENHFSLVPVRALEFGLARQVRLSRPTSACSFSTLRLYLVLTHGTPLDFHDGVHIYCRTPSGQYRVVRSRDGVSMAFTAESSLAQGQ